MKLSRARQTDAGEWLRSFEPVAGLQRRALRYAALSLVVGVFLIFFATPQDNAVWQVVGTVSETQAVLMVVMAAILGPLHRSLTRRVAAMRPSDDAFSSSSDDT